jgi:hypothetical protein
MKMAVYRVVAPRNLSGISSPTFQRCLLPSSSGRLFLNLCNNYVVSETDCSLFFKIDPSQMKFK